MKNLPKKKALLTKTESKHSQTGVNLAHVYHSRNCQRCRECRTVGQWPLFSGDSLTHGDSYWQYRIAAKEGALRVASPQREFHSHGPRGTSLPRTLELLTLNLSVSFRETPRTNGQNDNKNSLADFSVLNVNIKALSYVVVVFKSHLNT